MVSILFDHIRRFDVRAVLNDALSENSRFISSNNKIEITFQKNYLN